jgi:muramoyltetrapeptide carboxypeptidase
MTTPSDWVVPPALVPGDLIAVVAPSSPFEASRGLRGLEVLRRRYRVLQRRDVFARSGFHAGPDDRRVEELSSALADPEVKAVLAMRGGVGATRIVDSVDFAALRDRPKWLVGFSDITSLHVASMRQRVASLHAVHVTGLGRGSLRAERELFDALEAPLRTRRHPVGCVVPGEASGPLVGGNLALLHDEAAAGTLALPDRCVLFLEDVGERPYRIDRMLQALRRAGHLARAAAVVLGDFTDCLPGPDGVSVERVLRDALLPLGVPVVGGLEAGHGAVNVPLVLGARATVRSLTADESSLEVGG